MEIKLLQLQEFINEKKKEYRSMRPENIREQSFIDGVMAAREFFEHAHDDILTVKEDWKKEGGVRLHLLDRVTTIWPHI